MSCKISVVVPAYNVEKYIEKCVDSIIGQTFTDIEIILVDDSSCDATGKICDGLALKDERVTVVHKQNGGLSDARNAGINAASGEFICFIDGDDYIHPKYCEILFNIITAYNADVSVCGFKKVYGYNIELEKNELHKTEVFNKREAMQELIIGEKFMNYAWNKLYRKSLFNAVSYPVGKAWEDLGTTYKLFDIAERIAYTDAQLYFYVQRDGSITSVVSVKNALDIYELEEERNAFLKNEYPDLCDFLEYRICISAYNVWSAALTNKFDGALLSNINAAVGFLNIKSKNAIKNKNCDIRYKIKLFLYSYLRPLLGAVIKIKRH